MKLSEQSIRSYIRRLIMETFYVSPEGDAMDKDQMEKQDPTFFKTGRGAYNRWGYGYSSVPAPPADVPGESENFGGAYDTRLIFGARQDFENANSEHIRKLGNLMGDPNILNRLTYSEEDILILPDISSQNEENLKQALELLYVIGDDFYDYVEHIYDLKGTGFGDFMRRQHPGNLIQRGVGQKTVLSGDHPLQLFFKPVEEGKAGMGRSLIVGRVDRIITRALANLNNMSPIEFRDAVYPAVESVIRKVYARMPHIQANKHIKILDNVLEAYLEAIYYVLAEVIGEINFEYTYDSEGMNQMIFIPSDPTVYNTLLKAAKIEGTYSKPAALQAGASKIASAFGDSLIYNPSPALQTVLRDLPDYYDMKFSVNPAEKGALQKQSSNTHDWRLKVNLGFGHGLTEFGIDRNLGYDAMDVYDEG